jgi:hypothetical protein
MGNVHGNFELALDLPAKADEALRDELRHEEKG